MGGIVLHHGAIAEMKTGEGKTFVAPLAAFLNALVGRGVHVVTVNDYLAKRDAQWIGQVFHRLGMSVGSIQHDAAYLFDPDFPPTDERLRDLRPVTRREAYAADVTYGTNNEFGFDYLRDNLVVELDAARPARPLLRDRRRGRQHPDRRGAHAADHLRPGGGIGREVRPVRAARPSPARRRRTTSSTRSSGRWPSPRPGPTRWRSWLGVENMFDDDFSLPRHLEQALKAHALYQRDRDYVVKDGEVDHRRRVHRPPHARPPLERGPAPGGRGAGGREDPERAAHARDGHLPELLPHVRQAVGHDRHRRDRGGGARRRSTTSRSSSSRPTGRWSAATTPTSCTRTQKGKWNAVIEEIVEEHEKGRPILVGTVSVEISEMLGEMLKRRGIKHNVLNAKFHEREAEIVAQAGSLRRRHDRHQHGRPRHRHPARRQPGDAGRRASSTSRAPTSSRRRRSS